MRYKTRTRKKVGEQVEIGSRSVSGGSDDGEWKRWRRKKTEA